MKCEWIVKSDSLWECSGCGAIVRSDNIPGHRNCSAVSVEIQSAVNCEWNRLSTGGWQCSRCSATYYTMEEPPTAVCLGPAENIVRTLAAEIKPGKPCNCGRKLKSR